MVQAWRKWIGIKLARRWRDVTRLLPTLLGYPCQWSLPIVCLFCSMTLFNTRWVFATQGGGERSMERQLRHLWAMQAAYNSDPAQIVACIGPSIGPDSYQVGEEVLALAQAKLTDADQYFHFPDGEEARPHFNLWQANAGQLIEAGVPPQQVEISGIDTAQHTDDFFSHRAEQGRCGLFAMMAWLDPRM